MERILSVSLAVGCVLAAVAAKPTVSDVSFTQNVAKRNFTVTYTLADAPAVITFDVLTNGVSIGAKNITHAVGDVNRRVEAGNNRTFVWVADRSWPVKIEDEVVDFKVKAWPVDDPPDVMVVNLVQGTPPQFYESFDSLVGGVAARTYKTDHMVFRKIPAKGVEFTMGGQPSGTGSWKPHRVAFTNNFYMAIYECTQRQLLNLTGERGTLDFAEHADADILPADAVAYGSLDAHTYNSLNHFNPWSPALLGQGTRSLLTARSFIKMARNATGLKLDLPTLAQWEYAARAGASSAFYPNDRDATYLDEIAWYAGNSTNEQTQAAEPHPVGLKQPNAWGLYDVVGNVREWVLDWACSTNYPFGDFEIDPPGPASNPNDQKELRGGSYLDETEICHLLSRGARWASSAPSTRFGFRFWAMAEAL